MSYCSLPHCSEVSLPLFGLCLQTSTLVSGGLGGQLLLWDVETLKATTRAPAASSSAAPATSAPAGVPAGASGPGTPRGSAGAGAGGAPGAGPTGLVTASSLAAQEGLGPTAGAPGAPGSGRESEGTAPLSQPLEGHKDSVYSVAINLTGTVVASGGTKKVSCRCAPLLAGAGSVSSRRV